MLIKSPSKYDYASFSMILGGTDTLKNIEYIQFSDQILDESKVDIIKTYSGEFSDYKFYNKGKDDTWNSRVTRLQKPLELGSTIFTLDSRGTTFFNL